MTPEQVARAALRIDWLDTESAARRVAEKSSELITALEAALRPLAAIADAYDINDLDGEARRFWGKDGVNDTPPTEIELYSSRGGKRLLTLDDCFIARNALKKLITP